MDWREKIIKPSLSLNVGGFCPSGSLTASCFGEVRCQRKGESWPVYKDKPLWPLCQLNLAEASYRPEILQDVVLLTVFISPDYMTMAANIIDSSDENPYAGWYLRSYNSLDDLQAITCPDHKSPLRPFEARWDEQTSVDYPTHDTLPIDFDRLGIGDYYNQEGIETLNRTKLGGWPSCIQSEPWWDYSAEGDEFQYAFQIDSEPKSHWAWGDGGAGYIARSRNNPNRWALDFQWT